MESRYVSIKKKEKIRLKKKKEEAEPGYLLYPKSHAK